MDSPQGFDLQQITDSLLPLVWTYGLDVLGAIAILVLGWMGSGFLRRLTRRGLERSSIDNTLVPFLSSLVYYLTLTMVVIAVLAQFGVPTAQFVAVLAAMGLAVGLALQGTLSNFAAGVMLLIFRPFRVGDYVEAGGTAGSVESIGVFATTMNTPDNVRIIVSNSAVYGSTIKNYSANDNRRNDLVMGVSYSDDLAVARETIERVLAADDRVLKDPAPVVAVSELGDSSVNFVVRPWCRKEDYWALRFDLNRQLKEELEKAGCSIPFPQRDVHLFQETAA
ncbi:MAG: mechanosensitive ion channel [Acidobacteriota bacterium]|jgi:small conductance mechanosensitive channel